VPIHNNEIADIFNRVADLLGIEGTNPLRIRASRGADYRGLPQSVRIFPPGEK
jgi:DNA polymerase (family 10)